MADDSFDEDFSSMSFHEDRGPSSPFNDAYQYADAGRPRNLRDEYLEMGRKFREVERRRKALDETMDEVSRLDTYRQRKPLLAEASGPAAHGNGPVRKSTGGAERPRGA